MYIHMQNLSRWLSIAGGVAVVLMMLLTTIDVSGKYILNAPVPGAAEIIASYFMIAAVFLPLSDTEVRGEAIGVDILYDRMSLAVRMMCNALGIILAAIFYAVIAWQNMAVAIDSYSVGEYVSGTWDIVIWPSKFLMPIGLFFALVGLAWRICHLRKVSMHIHEQKDPV